MSCECSGTVCCQVGLAWEYRAIEMRSGGVSRVPSLSSRQATMASVPT